MNDLDYKVENGDTLIVFYDLRAEDEQDLPPAICEFRMKLPKEYKILLQDAIFVESVQALFYHLVAMFPLQLEDKEYIEEIVGVADLRRQLIKGTRDIIDAAIARDESEDTAKVEVPLPKNKFYNNIMLDLIHG